MNIKDQPKRLGRGLAALMGEPAQPAVAGQAATQNLPIDVLEPSPFQPRRDMDETALQELADSIGQRGILQPLLVRPKPGAEGQYQIIAGERRWRAAQKARLHEVPVLVRGLSDSDAMAAGLVENLQREDLNPVEEAQGYERLMREFKMTQEQMGEAIGKSRVHITNSLRILKLPEKVLSLVQDGTLSAGHARALLSHPQPIKGAKTIMDRDFTVRQAETWINEMGHTFKGKLLTSPPPKRMATDETEALEISLSERLGLRVKIVFNGKGGSVSLNYRDLDQLDTILALLNS